MRRPASHPARSVRARLAATVACSAFTAASCANKRQRIAAFDARAGESGVARRRPRRFARSVGVAAGWPPTMATCSSTQRVCTLPATKSGCARMLRRNGMLVATPSSRNSLSARGGAADRDGEIRRGECTITLASSESNAPLVAIARVAEPVRPHARPARRLIDGQRAAAGPNRTVRADGFHVDAGLDRVAARTRRGVTT